MEAHIQITQGLDCHPNLDQVLQGTDRWQAAMPTELRQHERPSPKLHQGRLHTEL